MKVRTIYIEKKVRDHPNTHKIIKNVQSRKIIYCDSYSEIFNTNNQNFRIQKKVPTLILAKKENNFLYKAPKSFTIGYSNNYYFSHMLNCPYDCQYCYLQGSLNSSNYLIFVNYEDFFKAMQYIVQNNNKVSCFFSGYESDNLALEKVTNFLENFIHNFKHLNKAFLEVRSKSVNIDIFKKIKPISNIIPAFSLNPQFIIDAYEDKTPNLLKRLHAIKVLQEYGWNVGLRFDPLIWFESKYRYQQFFNQVFSSINILRIHSVTLGNFRMPKDFLKKIAKISPNNQLVQKKLIRQIFDNDQDITDKFGREYCLDQIKRYVPEEKVFLN